MSRLALRPIKVYDTPDGPCFQGHHADGEPQLSGALTAVTYNIDHGWRVVEAVEVFHTIPALQHADVILLQEMDEVGTERIAQAMGWNFTYCPAIIAPRHHRNFGNAILSPWPLADPTKVILPNRHPLHGQMRIAVRATLCIGDRRVIVYSVHTETYTVPVPYRRAQVQALVDHVDADASCVVVGGDFNTVSRRSIQRIREQFAAIGMVRASAGAGPTVGKLGTRPSAADHIYTRGFEVLGRGAVESAAASDHFPVWVRLRPCQ